ncbi:MAG: AAA family ATPase [Thermomicrobiales bacterium]
MYKSIRIQNFRGLTDLRIDDLGRVNLIVGANNVGKTSLLEALWLFQDPGNPSITIDLANARGYEPLPRTAEVLWHGLFWSMEIDRIIAIEGITTKGESTKLEVLLAQEGTETAVLNGQPFFVPTTLRFRFHPGSNGQLVETAIALVGPGKVRPSQPAEFGRVGAYLPSGKRLAIEVVAGRFTSAQDSGQGQLLVRSLQGLDPRLTGLSLGYITEEERPFIRAHSTDSTRPMLLNLLGGGVMRLSEALLSILNARNGLALIDEIEDGIYARSLSAAWRAIDNASRQATVQVFATTHSWECVSAAVEAFADDPEEFRLHRLEREGEKVRVVTYDHEVALAAITGHVEVR